MRNKQTDRQTDTAHTQAVNLFQHSLMQSASPYSNLSSIRRQRHKPCRRTYLQHFFSVTAASCM